MTIQPVFQDQKIAQQYHDYVSSSQQKDARVVGHVLSTVFSLEKGFSNDPVENLAEAKTLFEGIDWGRVRAAQVRLGDHPLTCRATVTDLILAAINRGLQQLEINSNLPS